MYVTRVGKKGVLNGEKCRHCGRVVRCGQVIAHCKTDNFTKPRFVIHMACMAGLVEKAPADISEIRIEQIRERIIESGDVWA